MTFYPPDFSEPEPLVGDWVSSESYEYNGCFLVKISPKHNWRVHFQGYGVPINLFSKNEKEHCFQLIVNYFDDADEYQDLGKCLRDFGLEGPPEEIKIAGREKRFDKYLLSNESIKDFQGTLIGPPTVQGFIIKEYFELYMYY